MDEGPFRRTGGGAERPEGDDQEMTTAETTTEENVPAELQPIRDLVNTFDLEDRVEQLTDPSVLRDWLVEHELLAPATPVSAADLAATIELREALRAILRVNDGHPVEAEAVEVVNRAAGELPLQLRFAPDGEPVLGPRPDGVRGALAAMLAGIALAKAQGTWAGSKCAPPTPASGRSTTVPRTVLAAGARCRSAATAPRPAPTGPASATRRPEGAWARPPEAAAERAGAGQGASTMASTSTGTPRGRAARPTAERACLPASPKTSTSSSLAPLTTLGWSWKSGALATKPVTLTTLRTRERSPSSALSAASRLMAQRRAASTPSSTPNPSAPSRPRCEGAPSTIGTWPET